MAKPEKKIVLSLSQRDYEDFICLKEAGFDLGAIFRLGLDAAWLSHFSRSRCNRRQRAASKWVQRDLFDL